MRIRIRRFERLRLAKPAFPSAPCPKSPRAPRTTSRGLGASPLRAGESSAWADVWHMAPSRFMVVPLSLPFGPSPTRLSRPCPLRLATTASADFSLRLSALPFQAQGESSLGKTPCPSPYNRRIYAMALWSLELRGHLPARPEPPRLVSGSCSSARGFAPRFLQTPPRGDALALRLCSLRPAHTERLSPPSHAPCWAHKRNGLGNNPEPARNPD